jgi:hypothetical protein
MRKPNCLSRSPKPEAFEPPLTACHWAFFARWSSAMSRPWFTTA